MPFVLTLHPKQAEKTEVQVVSDEIARLISEKIKTAVAGTHTFQDKDGETLFLNLNEFRAISLVRQK